MIRKKGFSRLCPLWGVNRWEIRPEFTFGIYQKKKKKKKPRKFA